MMSSCDHIPQMHAYHDGELAPAEADTARRHAAACPACAAELEALRSMQASLRSAAGTPDATGLDMDRLLRCVRRAATGESQRGVLRLAWSLTAAAAAIVLVCLPQLPWTGASDASAATSPPAWEVAALALWSDSAPPASAEQLWAQLHTEDLMADDLAQEQP